MNNNTSENNNSSDYETISTIEELDSIFDNVAVIIKTDQNKLFDEINQSIDKEDIRPGNNFYRNDDFPKKCCTCNLNMLLSRSTDFFLFIVLVFDAIFYFISTFVMVAVFVVSYYSVIIMNYVFFVSSIVSYSIAPINKIMSQDWLNFALSAAQVILASPLIAFYILFISKSVKNLADFIEDIRDVVKNFLVIFSIEYKHTFRSFILMVFECNYKRIFKWNDAKKILIDFSFSLIKLILSCSFGYVTFFIDKGVVMVGSVCYIINILQIFALIAPSYLYLIQTLIGYNCKKIKYVYWMKNVYDNWAKMVESNDSDSNKSESKKEEEKSEKKEEEDVSDKSVTCIKELEDVYKDTYNIIISLTKEEEEDKNEDNDDKIIDDKFIDTLPNDEKILKAKVLKFIETISDLISAEKYLSLYYFSTEIAFDRHKQIRKMIIMYIFLLLNLAIISYDIYQLTRDYSDYLLSSIIIRFILVPLFTYYNIVTVLYHRAKDKVIRSVNYASIAITFIIALIIIFAISYTHVYQKKYRINNLEYFPPLNNITIINEKATHHPICDYKILDVSAFDAFGYALGGFDVNRNNTIFDNQMKIFFGENYSNHISYKIYKLDKFFQFMKFYDSSINTTIFAFRGYNSGPEIAFQLELLASQYIIPFFEDNVPFLSTIIDFWLGFYTDFLHAFGLRFFENRNLMVKYVNSIRKIYYEENYTDFENVLFTGINTGGVIAKVVGTLVYQKSISFISFPMELDFVAHLFHYPESYMNYVTNVFNVDGIFSHQDSDHTINIGIDTPLFHQSNFCSSGLCEIFSRWDNIYRTFCTMSETCGRGNQFNYYCLNTIGEKNLEIIRESLQNND